MEDVKTAFNRIVETLETQVSKLEAKVDALTRLPDRLQIEDLPKKMAWGIDTGDRELWLSVWADDIVYRVPQYDIEIKGREELSAFGEVSVFGMEERRFSAITNILVDVKGDTATGRDYFMHYGFPKDQETGQPSEERALAEGTHHYEFAKRDGVWKITHFEVFLNRRQEAGA